MVDEKDLEEKELNKKDKEENVSFNEEPVEEGKEEKENPEKNEKEANELGSENSETKPQDDKNLDTNEKKEFEDLDPETESSDENSLEDEELSESESENELEGKTEYDFGEKELDEDLNKESDVKDDLKNGKEDLGDKIEKEPDEKNLGDIDSIKKDVPKDSMKEQEGPNKALVYKEIGKYFSSKEMSKGNRLIAALGKENIRGITDMVYDAHIGSFKKGEELEAAKEIYLKMALMGGTKTAIEKFENEGKLDNNKLVQLDPEEMDDEVKKSVELAVTDPKGTLEETKTATFFRDKLMFAVGLDGNPLYGFLQGLMEEMEKDISENLELMNGPRTTIPKEDAKRLKEFYDSKVRELEGSLDRGANNIEREESMPKENDTFENIDEKDKDIMANENKNHEKAVEKAEDNVPSRESDVTPIEEPKEDRGTSEDFDKSEVLNEALEEFDKFAKSNGLNKDNASREVVERVKDDALNKTKDKLAEMADRNYIEEKENMTEQHKHNQDR